jgi:hypothetical protein
VSALLKLAGFAAALAGLFGAGALAGAVSGAEAPGGERRAEAGHGEGEMAMSMPAVRGLSVASDGLRLVVEDPERRRGATAPLRFRIVDGEGRAVRHYDVEHTKRMHLIVARRDLTGFQHLHPTMEPDGTWTAPLKLREPGAYRLFADFSRGGRPTTLATDLRVDGAADLRPLPAGTTVATTGPYAVRLAAGRPRAGREAALRFTITRDGRPVRTEPYLGAGGHLVALREGDLAFLHVHPTDGVGFEATFPTAGAYRLFLQFHHRGRVHTVAFTQEVGA